MSGTPSKPTATKTTASTNPTVTHTTTHTKPTGAKPTVSSDTEGITIVKTVHKERAPEKYAPEGKLGKYEYDLIASPNGWLT